MKIIDSVRIKYYRSILNTTRGNVTHLPVNELNVVVGGNDAGKSNFLRALNLFFNHDKEFFDDFDFWKEFSIQRHKVKGEVGRIEIELIIKPPKR
jgi:AAA15 family ATPase/GTPase